MRVQLCMFVGGHVCKPPAHTHTLCVCTPPTHTHTHTMGGIIICIESQVLKDAEEHLRLATQERSYYGSAIEASKEVLRNTFAVDGSLQVPPVGSCLPPLSHEIEMHFSLDMAQQVQAAKLI